MEYLRIACAIQRIIYLLEDSNFMALELMRNVELNWSGRLSPSEWSMINVAHAAISMQSGDLAKALRHAQTAVGAARNVLETRPRVYAAMSLAYALTASGDWQSAAAMLEELNVEVAQSGSNYCQLHLHLLISQIATLCGDVAGLRSAFVKVFRLMRSLAGVRNLFVSSENLSLLCTIALENGLSESDVSTIVLQKSLMPTFERLNERWPWRFKIYTLGDFSLSMDGVPYGSRVRHSENLWIY
ncbi:tetratricopeptide repeat protein [Cupriavidus sp. D39]|uniref:tetratricopeptide repeat protein n=1 Tax=Cupriavidus sp. D39 TaxID=2997877 RepID=UPI00226D6D3C|nr:hypothetical protein [Cupriavidus sp. D39]MCY0858738.1 hypothetical protein [Cupriavidus sp. D39]